MQPIPSFIQHDVPLAPYTTPNIGGRAEYFVEVADEAMLHDALVWAGLKKIPITVLGGGSNVLVRDSGVPGLVVRYIGGTITYHDESKDDVLILADAGVSWDVLVDQTVVQNLSGLEYLSGIPGNVGAAPIQNINAYGASVSHRIVSVTGYHKTTHERRIFTGEACAFGYRDSFFKSEEGKHYLITNVTFRLSKTEMIGVTSYKSASQSIQKILEQKSIRKPTLLDIREAVLSARRNIGMLQGMYHSAGSFFKNCILDPKTFSRVEGIVNGQFAEIAKLHSPWHWTEPNGTVKVSTAFLMECTPYNKNSFRGKTFHGTVGISPQHTLSLININDARAEDVFAFAKEIETVIKNTFGIEIFMEVCTLP